MSHFLCQAAFQRPWLTINSVLGSLFPNVDNLAVTAATLTKSTTAGLHFACTQSPFTVAAVTLFFYLVGLAKKDRQWNNLAVGLGAGIFLHIVVFLALVIAVRMGATIEYA